MRILVTGANGQLGNEMQVLAKENPQHTYYFTDVQELDICNKDAVWAYIAEKRIELIVNCAAYTAVDKAEDDSELAYKLNSEAPKTLACAAQFNGAAMIQVSTDYVFDGTAHIPYTEECDPCPNSVYGTTKLEGEYEVLNHCEKSVVIRTDLLIQFFRMYVDFYLLRHHLFGRLVQVQFLLINIIYSFEAGSLFDRP
jgi:dTDP-4-dehydrorhamnose reductase